MSSDINLAQLSSEERRRLLEELLDEQEVQQSQRFCVSSAQERLWLLDRLTPGNPVYNIWAAVRLKGKLDLNCVHQSINLLIERHETLRTIFIQEDGHPYQLVQEPWQIQIPIDDLSINLAEQQQSRLKVIVEQFIARPFDIANGPLLRAHFVRLGERDHVALFSMHHAISDGWSLGILIKEFTEVYASLRQKRAPVLEELDIQYADYAQWQRDNQDNANYRDQIEYWISQLTDAPTVGLPFDFPAENGLSQRGSTVIRRVSKPEWQKFKEICSRRSATPFMGLVGILQFLLSRLTGQDDITIGTPIAGRSRKELEALIGCFLNTLCLRNKVDESNSFAEYLSQVRQTAFNAYKNQDVPFERVLSELQVGRDIHQSPLFNVMLNLLSYQSPELKLPDLTVERFDIDETLAKFDITLYAEPVQDELELRLVYNAGLFSKHRMQLFVDQFVQLLNETSADSNRPLCDISLVLPFSSAKLDDPSVIMERPHVRSVAEQFIDISNKYPDHTAIEFGGHCVSYSELRERAQTLCESIIEGTSDNNPVVAIAFDKSIGLIVGMLAVQMAGRVLVCIDPSFPADRQSQLLALSHASLLIDPRGIHCIEISASLPQRHADNKPAYIFFTSGSTGTPKAVVGSRQGLAHFVAWQRVEFAISPEDRFAQLTAVSFDVVLREVFTPLTSGATICLPPSAEMTISNDVLKWLAAESITVVHSVPSLLQHWLGGDCTTVVPSLRYLFSAGEPLTDQLCELLRSRCTNASIVNLYGPTETTLAKFFKSVDPPRRGIQLVGKPIPNTQVLLLKGMRRCGIGEIGEIVVRTPFRSHGYLDAALNDLKYVINPWTGDADDLLYRTGDLGRITPEGELEILGRLDDQVKIRGVRIEPAEVSSVLKQFGDIQECVTVATANENHEKRLVAYVVAKNGADVTTLHSRLSDYAATKLPPAMNPSVYVTLNSIPLLSNGKVDRRKLPMPAAQQFELSQAESPSTDTERDVAKIWISVLGREFVGRQDSFFAIGGHSLLAAQVISRVEQAFERAVPLRAIFEAPTLERFSAYLDGLEPSSVHTYLPAIEKRDATLGSPLSLAQEALWFLDRMNPKSGAYTTYPMLRVHGDLRLEMLQGALDVVVNRHEVLRTTFPEIDGSPVQKIASSASSKLHLTDLSQFTDRQQQVKLDEWIAGLLRDGIDLQRGPIVRLHIARLGKQEHVAVVVWHHIIHDGWSLGVLAREILTAYRDISERRNSTLPTLPVQYADWAFWQRQLLSGEYLQKLSDYWKTKLDQLPPLDLLTDSPRPAIRTTNGGWVPCAVDARLSALVDKFSRERGVTPYMIFLTAFHLTLARFSGNADFAIGSPVANRRKRETEDLIGYFINMLVMRPHVEAAESFGDALLCVKSTVLDAFEHQDMTLDQVVHAVNPARDTSRHPLFQAMFVLHNNAPLPDVGEGLRFEPLPNPPVHSSYFELNFVLQQTDDRYDGRLIYNCDLFRAATMERLVTATMMLLESGLKNANQNWRDIPIVDPEQAIKIEAFTRPDASPIQIDQCNGTLHSRFEHVTQSRSSAIALVDGSRQFTYQQLDLLADRFAKKLRSQGVEHGDLVALLLPRSADAIVAILGILKCGAAYVPLDERSPESRNLAILENSGVNYLICDSIGSQFAGVCKQIAASGASNLSAPALKDSLEGKISESLHTSEDRAYVIYTSGSTGNPKGVAVSHGAVLAYALAAASQYGVTADDRVLQFSSLSFDAHVEELFVTLLKGATLVLRSDSMLDSVHGFLNACDRLRISTLSMSTGFWHEIALETADSKQRLPGALRAIIIGGEAAHLERVRKWYETHGTGVRLVNSYGPTETTVVATAVDLVPSQSDAYEIPIGRPLQNTRAYVLDSRLSPVPIGARGELFLGGLSVAEGYLGNEELTQQKFVLDQFDAGVFGARSEPRMYRTGDIVAWRDDGQLRFFGRNDFQLKVRGFRVELGEIENAIRQHPLVQDVVVDAHFGNGEPTIAAYIVSNGPSALNTLTIRQYLSNSVPEYMLPSHVICLDEIPLTVSGKIDRKSLPAPDTEAELLNEFVAPSSATEVQLANIVRSVLHKDRISANDNFFQIGGNSLLALRLTSQIRKQFSVDLPLVQLFQSPTLASLAKLIDAFGAQTPNASDDPLMSLAAFQSTTADIKSSIGSGASSLVTLRDSAIGSPIFCIHGLGGHIVNFIPLSRELKTDRPIVGIQGVGVDGQNAPHEGIEEMARYYARQIITRQPSGPVQVIGWSMGGLIAMEIARELQSHGRCAHDLIMLDTHLSLADRSLEEVTEESVIKQIAPRVGLSIKNLRRLTIEQQWEHVLEASQQYTGSKHSDGNADEIRRLAEMCKSHLIAIGRYQPKRIEKKIFMLQAARPWRLADPRWRLLCTGFASETVAGSHYSMLASPDVQQVCRAIEKILESNCIKDGERS